MTKRAMSFAEVKQPAGGLLGERGRRHRPLSFGVAGRGERCQRRPLDEAAMGHPQRVQDLALHVRGERLIDHLLDGELQQAVAAVGVVELAPGFGGDPDVVRAGPVARLATPAGQGLFQGRQWPGGDGRVVLGVQSGGVGEQPTDDDPARVESRGWQVPPRQVGLHGRVQIDAPLFDQAHHAPRGHRLGDRPDAEDGVRRDRDSGRGVGEAVASGPGVDAAADLRHRNAWYLERAEPVAVLEPV